MRPARLLFWGVLALSLTGLGLAEVRIRRLNARLQSPIVVFGDSITERARLPDTACGHPIVNAGLGGASTVDFIKLAPVWLDQRPRPHIIVVALGANDVGSTSLATDFATLLTQLAAVTPNIIAVSNTADPGVLAQQRAATAATHIPFVDTRVTGLMSDRTHFTADGYRQWLPPILDAVAAVCASQRSSR